MNKPKLLYAGAGLLAVALLIGILIKISDDDKVDTASQPASVTTTISIPTEIIGDEMSGGSSADQVGMSWPGEIFSSGDVEVQPQREGTIVEWKVKIGQKVKSGQVLARLSAPPATSELTRTLAEQVQSFTKAKAVAEAEATFVAKNKQQLIALRTQIVASGQQISDSLSGDATSDRSKSLATLEGSLEAAHRDIQIKTQSVKDYSAQAIREVFPLFTNFKVDPILAYAQYQPNFYSNLRDGLGNNNGGTQTDYTRSLVEAVKAAVQNDPAVGEKTLTFLQRADSLVANSLSVDDSVAELAVLRDTVSDERAELSEKIIDLTEAKTEVAKIESELASKKTEFSLTSANSSKETAENLKEIDEKLIDLDRQLQLARAEADAAAAAYYTISAALTGGLNIKAPRAGIVSTILKKNGDFVNTSDSVASINSGNEKDRIVRFRIPGNITPPQAGEILTVIRPGFPGGGKKIKLAGTGLSLDGVGSFLADADFMEPVDWPTHASVRVMTSQDKSGHTFASLSAVWWDASGHPFVWLVTEENRIRAQAVKTGRALGDKVEIIEGLVQGNRIVLKATGDLKTGMQLSQIQNSADKKIEEQPEADGHGHDE